MATETSVLGKLGIDTEEYEQKLLRLEQEYQRQREELTRQRDTALAEAYVGYRLQNRSLPDLLSFEGKQGGIEQSERMRILAEYLTAREKAQSLYGAELLQAQQQTQSKQQDYRGRISKLKKEAELQIAEIKAKEAAAAAKTRTKAGSGNTKSSYASSFAERQAQTDRKKRGEQLFAEDPYQPKGLYKNGVLNLKK